MTTTLLRTSLRVSASKCCTRFHIQRPACVMQAAGIRTHVTANMAAMEQKQRVLTMDQDARRIFDAAVTSVLPPNMIHRTLQRDGDTLMVGDRSYDISRGVYVVGFGKAVLGMVKAVEDILGDKIVDGIASVPQGITSYLTNAGKQDLIPSPECKVRVMEGAPENIPDQTAFDAAKEIETLLAKMTDGDVVLTMISGGGSALLPYPIPPVTLEEMATLTRLLSRGGASIQQLNTIRKHIEKLKGGGLAKSADPAEMVTLILSDVVGDDLDFIASGPTVPDLLNPGQSLELISQLGLKSQVPESVLEVLREREVSFRTACQGGNSSGFPMDKVHNVLVGTNKLSLQAAKAEAERLGYIPVILTSRLSGDINHVTKLYMKLTRYMMDKVFGSRSLYESDVATTHSNVELELVHSGINKKLINEIRAAVNHAKNSRTPICILAGGEPTVQVKGQGQGGRNQQMALDIALEFDKTVAVKQLDYSPVFLSGGTDGQDGPTDAAGAVVDCFTVAEARRQNLNPEDYARKNDSYSFFSQLRNQHYHLVTGLTGTNVMDIQVFLLSPNNINTDS